MRAGGGGCAEYKQPVFALVHKNLVSLDHQQTACFFFC